MQILIHNRRLMRWLWLAIFLGASFSSVAEDTLVAPEYKIKAAFLYNFAVLTEWPDTAFDFPKQPLTIGVLGKDPFGRTLEKTMRGKTVHGRKIEIARYKTVEQIEHCHLLFISSSEEKQVEEILTRLAGRPILTVSEIDRFNYKGGVIWLQKQEDQIKFRIRRSAARKAKLKLSSRLLALAINATPPNRAGK